jgi:methylated-DNA-protein-cysteine methyltransferase-like protein
MSESFFRQVYEIVARIPRGKVVTYGQLAIYLGSPGAARTVGWAMKSAPPELDLPCHRVVDRAGRMAPDHVFGGLAIQRSLLESEGVGFDAEGRIDLDEHLWAIGPDSVSQIVP